MNESSNLTDLSRKLKGSKKQELEQVKEIEREKLNALSESLRKSLAKEVSTIEDDMSKRLTKLREKMSEARQNIIKDENEALKTLRTNRQSIEDESESLMQSLNKVKLRYWIVPLIVGVSLILGLTLGTYALGSWITSQHKDLQTVRAEVAKAEQIKKSLEPFTPVSKIYKNGIEVKKGYKIEAWQGKDNGLWFAEIKKGR